MQSNNQSNKSQDTLKQAIIAVWFACLRRCCFVLLCGLVIFCSFSYADNDYEVFCFTDLGGGTCSGNTVKKFDFLEVGEKEKGSDPIVIMFKFRAYEVDDGEEDESEEWNLKRESLFYSQFRPEEISEDSYNIQMTSPKLIESWSAGNSGRFSGGDDEDRPDKYYTAELRLTFIDSYFNDLEAGEHFFWLTIKGRVDDDESYNTFYIGITVEINTKVKISGLKNVPFGTFLADDFSRVHTQKFCAHVQGGKNFKITPTSENLSFKLKGTGTGSVIPYKVFVANVGQTPTPIDYGDTRGGLEGEASEDCTSATGKNMQLKVELPEISVLSVKPADSYMDKLTLTIEPD